MSDETTDPRRALPVESAENVRDLGGYSTRDGQTTQWGRFVRAGDLHQVSQEDQQTLRSYGIRCVIDLRMAKERTSIPNVFVDDQELDFRVHDFWGTRFDDYRSPNRRAEPAIKLADLYCAGLEKSGHVMAAIMANFADSNTPAYLFHCRSGKDRTGLVSALLLELAGVPRATICADYALTSTLLKMPAINPIEARQPGAWQRGCEAETMERTLDFLSERFGGAREYLLHNRVSEQQLDTVLSLLLEP